MAFFQRATWSTLFIAAISCRILPADLMPGASSTPLSAQLHDAMVAMVDVEAVFMRPVYVDETVQCVYRVAQIEHVAKGRSKTTIEVSIHTTDAPPDAARQAHCVVHLTFLLKTHLQG